MHKKIFIVSLIGILIVGTFLLASCSKQTVKENDSKINVMVSVLPQVDFVERIGGDKVAVLEMIPPGFSPATYDPSPGQLQKLQTAEIYFRIGHIPFEKAQMEKIKQINSSMKIVDTSKGIELLKLAAHSHDDEEHEYEHGEGEHENEEEHEEGDDPHIWLSPKLVKIQAKHIYEALSEYSPNDKDYFTENYKQFIADLDDLDDKLSVAFEPIKGQTFLVFHPAFGYLADAYNFEQEAIEIEGKDPTPGQLQEIIDKAKAENIKVVFVQAQFSIKSAEAVAREIRGAVVQIDPLAKDYFTNLESMAETIVNSIK